MNWRCMAMYEAEVRARGHAHPGQGGEHQPVDITIGDANGDQPRTRRVVFGDGPGEPVDMGVKLGIGQMTGKCRYRQFLRGKLSEKTDKAVEHYCPSSDDI